MIRNRAQLMECVQLRRALWRLLYQEQEDASSLAAFKDHPEILCGLTSDWLTLLSRIEGAERVSSPLPSVGHVFIQACAEPNAFALKRLLVDLEVDPEQCWDIPGQEVPWSAWIWLASTVRNDGVVASDITDQSWDILLPQLLAAGMDMERSCKLTGMASVSRREYLENENAERFQAACRVAEHLRLQRFTPELSCNSASRRL